ncbi:DCC1-like thiol-disulfide oxidoreductase family protein [Myxococcota bacterium]|nr:DCC1-like thiol-disulfide oxidoreductase family protein [Myxococcota bacterium]
MIILYDGVCGLCNQVVQFVLPRDRKNQFQFAQLQSELGQALLKKHGKPTDVLDTFYLVLDHDQPTEHLIGRARAGLRVAVALGGPWILLGLFLALPDFILDPAYDFVAKNRYRWFGRTEACMLPKPEWRHKFLA